MKKTIYWLLLGGLLLMPGRAAYADDGSMNGRVIIGQNFTLQSGETVDGDLVVIGGEAAIEVGATVRGDLVVIGGSLGLDGEILGSAVVIGGSASLGATGSVSRDLVALGGSFQRGEGSRIGGDIITNLAITTETLPRATAAPTTALPPGTDFRLDFGPLGTLAAVFFQAIGLGAVAMLLTAFLHPQVDRVAQAVQAQPFAAGSFGLLTVFLAPLAIVVMAITLILIPLALAAAMLLVLAWLFGVIAVGQIVGERLTQAMHRTWEPVLSAGLGAFVLGIVLGTSNQIPCVGWMASVLIGLVGLGAAAMTLFGTRSQLRASVTAVSSDTGVKDGGPLAPVG
ncbi:MAG: hypothetical protein V1755_11810 [Chloroflexota bacterium]